MRYYESETVELKATYVDDIKNEAVAMANCSGGTIYVGVSDNGEVVGIDNPDAVIQRISNALRDCVKPDITMFLSYETFESENKTVVAVKIQSGAHRPYYFASKGLRPQGVYVRRGTSCVCASDSAIRRMIKETDGDIYENARSLNQNLTINRLTEEFGKRGLELGAIQMKTLGITDGDSLYTNLGLLLSDQCPHIIKAAVFAGTDMLDFQDRREFTGSVLKQLEDAYSYLDMNNKTVATFEGLLRVDHRDYPDTAVREALLNAVVHRDYSLSAATLLSVYGDRIEFISAGGLVSGVTLDDVMLGLSACRNQRLADLFYRLKLIEAYGTGIKKIVSAYTQNDCSPEILATSGAFKLVLPNTRTKIRQSEYVAEQSGESENVVLNLIKAKKRITRREVESALGLSSATASRLLSRMLKAGLIVADGDGRSRGYILS